MYLPCPSPSHPPDSLHVKRRPIFAAEGILLQVEGKSGLVILEIVIAGGPVGGPQLEL